MTPSGWLWKQQGDKTWINKEGIADLQRENEQLRTERDDYKDAANGLSSEMTGMGKLIQALEDGLLAIHNANALPESKREESLDLAIDKAAELLTEERDKLKELSR